MKLIKLLKMKLEIRLKELKERDYLKYYYEDYYTAKAAKKRLLELLDDLFRAERAYEKEKFKKFYNLANEPGYDHYPFFMRFMMRFFPRFSRSFFKKRHCEERYKKKNQEFNTLLSLLYHEVDSLKESLTASEYDD